MKSKISIIVLSICIICLAPVALAIAGIFSKSHTLKHGSTSFVITVEVPKKIILYPESIDVKTSYSIVCLKSGKVSHLARSFTTGYTRNLLYKIPPKQDVCYVSVAAATTSNKGQIVVQGVTRDDP